MTIKREDIIISVLCLGIAALLIFLYFGIYGIIII